MIDFDTLLDWIKKIGGYRDSSTEWLQKYIVTKENLEEFSCIDFTIEDQYIDAIDNWCIEHSREQIVALVFRIIGIYWLKYLKCQTVEDLENYIKNRILCNITRITNEERNITAYRILSIIFYFLNNLGHIVDAHNINMRQMWKQLELSEELMEAIVDYSKNNGENTNYKTMKRTHRIAALRCLIEKSKLCQNIDKTKIAEFVEAVTGGNIEIAGKDTMAYKNPTKDAQAAAIELLQKIGVE